MCPLNFGHNGFYYVGNGTGNKVKLNTTTIFNSSFPTYLGNMTDCAVYFCYNPSVQNKLECTDFIYTKLLQLFFLIVNAIPWALISIGRVVMFGCLRLPTITLSRVI